VHHPLEFIIYGHYRQFVALGRQNSAHKLHAPLESTLVGTSSSATYQKASRENNDKPDHQFKDNRFSGVMKH
jgi:hypothetical protein